MTNNFKPGDPALTLAQGVDWPPMTQVTLDIFLAKGELAQDPAGGIFEAPHDGWSVYREGERGCEFYRPEHLMPLRRDYQSAQQKSRVVIA